MKRYVAGFLDADGSVSLSSKSAKHDWMRRPEVAFHNADLNLLKTIKKEYGGSIRARKFDNPNWNTSYELLLNCNQSIKLLTDVVPFMLHSKKKKRAELIVKYYKKLTPRNGRYTDEMIEKKRIFNEKVTSIVMRGVGAY